MILFFSNQKELLGALAVAAKGGRILGWEEARLYARLSVNFVSSVYFWVNENEIEVCDEKLFTNFDSPVITFCVICEYLVVKSLLRHDIVLIIIFFEVILKNFKNIKDLIMFIYVVC